MPVFKIIVAYDGTEYIGWQRQAEGVSIQGLIEDALRPLDERDVTVIGAGRTDAGVHAYAQVAGFSLERRIDPDTLVRALNFRLPADVRVRSAVEVPATFHARFDARLKTYRYRIWNDAVLNPFERRYTWHITEPLDCSAMCTAARRLEGEHDFAAFQGTGGETATTVRRITQCGVRNIEDSAFRAPHSALLEFSITGTGFLRHMVRNIIGTLVEVGRRRQPPEWIDDVLASGDRTMAGRTAPAQGLVLVSVDYGGEVAAER